MEQNGYVKVFAGLAIYYDLIPRSLVDENLLKGNLEDKENDPTTTPLFSGNLKDIKVSTLYLMQHFDEGCSANCAFCVQARDSVNKNKKSLLVDKEIAKISFKMLKNFLKTSKRVSEIERICIQTVFHKDTVENLIEIVKTIREVSDLPVSACCIPVSKESLIRMREAGIDRVTINYETATDQLFSKIRGKEVHGPYHWDIITKSIDDAVEVYGAKNVTSHLQIGLGETQREALQHIQNLYDKKVMVGLFSFCPVQGTALAEYKRVSHAYFHKIQLGSYLIKTGKVTINQMKFNSSDEIVDFGVPKEELDNVIKSGIPFKNTGCPGCNRVYYETNPGERFYSYPRNPYENEIELIKSEIM